MAFALEGPSETGSGHETPADGDEDYLRRRMKDEIQKDLSRQNSYQIGK